MDRFNSNEDPPDWSKTSMFQEGHDIRHMFGSRDRKNPYPIHSARYKAWEAGWTEADQSLLVENACGSDAG